MGTSPTLAVISLGGGMHSSVMMFMAVEDALGPALAGVVFPGTDWEPPGVYEQLKCPKGPAELPLVRRGQ